MKGDGIEAEFEGVRERGLILETGEGIGGDETRVGDLIVAGPRARLKVAGGERDRLGLGWRWG